MQRFKSEKNFKAGKNITYIMYTRWSLESEKVSEKSDVIAIQGRKKQVEKGRLGNLAS